MNIPTKKRDGRILCKVLESAMPHKSWTRVSKDESGHCMTLLPLGVNERDSTSRDDSRGVGMGAAPKTGASRKLRPREMVSAPSKPRIVVGVRRRAA